MSALTERLNAVLLEIKETKELGRVRRGLSPPRVVFDTDDRECFRLSGV